MVDKFRARGWSIAKQAYEDITLGQVVSLEPTLAYAQICQPGTRIDRAVGVAWAGDFQGKVGFTEGQIAASGVVSIQTHGKVIVVANEEIFAGDALCGAFNGTVAPLGTDPYTQQKTIGNAVTYAAASGDNLEMLLGQG